jgi:NAD(P)-dependent dehydrogenase (short-subunit alcohol dehydrogenase family)
VVKIKTFISLQVNEIWNLMIMNFQTKRKIFIVNITSLLSVKAYPSFTQYSVGKAAREAYFRGFATENPSCRVLNYSPGPVDTDMHTEVSLT